MADRAKARRRATPLKRWVWAFDSHGDMVDPDTLKEFRMFVKSFKPDFRGHGGDFVDLRAWRGGASAEDRADSMRDDVEAGRELLGWFNPQVVILGNHDHRMVKVMERHPDPAHRVAASMCWDAMLDAFDNAKVVPYGKREFHQHGNYKVIHGYASGVYAARKHAQAYGNCLAGHVHAFTEFTEPDLYRSVSVTSGALCRTDMEYNAGQLGTLRQENGWLYGFEVNGELAVFKARKVGGVWLYPTEMRGAA